MASKSAALSIVGLFVVFLVVLVVVQFLKPYRREGFYANKDVKQPARNGSLKGLPVRK
jgi:hypothetical protein